MEEPAFMQHFSSPIHSSEYSLLLSQYTVLWFLPMVNRTDDSWDVPYKKIILQLSLSPCRHHTRPPIAQEEDEDEERILSSSTSADGHSLAVDSGAEHSHQQQLPSAGEEGDEGSFELSDEVSRDSTMGSDSDTFSSPFCLSPVSEALCESSSSVFLDSESRSVKRQHILL